MEGGSGDGTAAQSLYAALGLSPEDVEALAQIPENEISVETLPYLIMQLKAKRAKKGSASADTDPGDKAQAGPKEPEEEPKQANPEAPEKGKEKRGSPPSSSSSRRSEGHSSNHDHEHHGKGDGHRRTERSAAGRRDSRHRKSSREGQTGDSSALEMELDDNPTVFPHVCTVCKIKVNEAKAWSGHLRGVRHMEARREYMRFSYSEDDSYSSRRSSRSSLPSKRSYSSERSTDLPSPSDRHFPPYMPFTRVVVAKFPMGCVAVADMLALGKPFGTIVKHLIFPFKGFLEFSSHGEAKDMVSHYHTKPAFIKGHRISLCLSPTVEVIHPPEVYEPGAKRMKSSQSVVCFSRLPVGKETEEEVLDIAAMFGDVRHSKFTEDRALIEMVDWRDADIMVKYYHSNPLRIQDKSIKVSLASMSSLRDGSPDHSTSKKSDTGKSHSSSSRQKNEATSSRSTSQSSSKDKEKSKSSSKEPPAAEPKQEKEKEKEGEEGEKEKEKEEKEKEKEENEEKENEEENEEKENEEKEQEMEKEEEEADNKEVEKEVKEGEEVGELKEEEPSQVNAEAAEDVDEGPMEEAEQKEAGGEEPDCKEEELGEEERLTAEKEESKGDKGSEEDMDDPQEDLDDMDFPENMDDFVTLDELDTLEASEPLEGKVVVVRPIMKEFREARKKAVRKDLHKMAAPFGKVVNFAISFYRREALIEMETAENAHEMVNYYRNSKKSRLVGRPVSVSICLAFDSIEGPSGRSLFISKLPSFKYSIMSLLRLAQPFGKITAYCSNRMYGTCYVQMETPEAAELMIQKFSRRPLKFYGSVLKITMCRKGDSLIPWTSADKFDRWSETKGLKSPRHSEERGENGQTSRNSTGEDRHSPVSNCEGVGGDLMQEGGDSEEEEEEERPQSPLGPYQPENAVGVEYVVARSGFFCKLCNVFYTDENRAKSEHCSSLEHYRTLKRKRGEEVEEEQTEEQTLDE